VEVVEHGLDVTDDVTVVLDVRVVLGHHDGELLSHGEALGSLVDQVVEDVALSAVLVVVVDHSDKVTRISRVCGSTGNVFTTKVRAAPVRCMATGIPQGVMR